MTSEVPNKRTTKSKPGVKNTGGTGYQNATFIQYELDKVAQAACKAWDLSETQAFDTAQVLIESGYRISLKHDDFNDCHAAFMQKVDPNSENGGLILTGRGSTPFKSFKQLLFKHYNVMAESWEAFETPTRSKDIDD